MIAIGLTTMERLEPGQRQSSDNEISTKFSNRHDNHEARQRLPHDTCNHGQWIANNRHPAGKQAPSPVAMIMTLGASQYIGRNREPSPVLKTAKNLPQTQFTVDPSTLPNVATVSTIPIEIFGSVNR